MKIKYTYTYTADDIETLNCLAFVASIAAVIVCTIARFVGIV